LKEIDEKLLNYEFIDLIQSKHLRKNMMNHSNYNENFQIINKENINRMNQQKEGNALDTDGLRSKKVPILKLSELNLR
jgi:hypothetical protein